MEKNLTLRYLPIQLFYCTSGYIALFASNLLLSRGFTNTQVGLTLALSSLFTILLQPFIAAFADKTTKIQLKTLIAAGMSLSLLSAAALMITPNILFVTAFFLIIMVGGQVLQQSLLAGLAMDQINRGNHVNFSLTRGTGSIVFALFAIVIGFLVSSMGIDVILPVYVIIALGCVISLICFPPSHGRIKSGGDASGFIPFVKENKRFMGAILCTILILFSHTIINSYTIQIIRSVGGDDSSMGIAVAVASGVEFPAMLLFPFILKKLRRTGLILKLAAVFFGVKTLVTILATSPAWFFVAQGFQFFAFAMYIPASVYYVNRIVKAADRVKGQAYMGLALAVSGLIGNFTGGFMIDSLGMQMTLIVSLIISALGAAAFIFIAPRDKEEV